MNADDKIFKNGTLDMLIKQIENDESCKFLNQIEVFLSNKHSSRNKADEADEVKDFVQYLQKEKEEDILKCTLENILKKYYRYSQTPYKSYPSPKIKYYMERIYEIHKSEIHKSEIQKREQIELFCDYMCDNNDEDEKHSGQVIGEEENGADIIERNKNEMILVGENGLDCAIGSILGAFTGDAAGAVLEFYPETIKRVDVDYALQFPGGGCFNVKPGQFTDDSEMALGMMRGLIKSEEFVDQVEIAKEYVKWYRSNPFDIGGTTANAIDLLSKFFKEKEDELIRTKDLNSVIEEIAIINKDSQSNGSLMRATPMAVYCHDFSENEINECTKIDVALTHSNPYVLYCVVCYNIAIAHLINYQGDVEGVKEKINKYLFTIEDDECESFKEDWKNLLRASEANKIDLLPPAKKKIGWVKIAFSYAFFYLFNGYNYEEAIRDILIRGGDTDTNAAIVGGLIGARSGKSNIPKEWIEKGIRFDNGRKHYTEIESVDELERMIEKLYNKDRNPLRAETLDENLNENIEEN